MTRLRFVHGMHFSLLLYAHVCVILYCRVEICEGKCTITFALLPFYGGLPLSQFDVPSSSVGLIIGLKGKQLRAIEKDAQLEKGAIKISQYEV